MAVSRRRPSRCTMRNESPSEVELSIQEAEAILARLGAHSTSTPLNHAATARAPSPGKIRQPVPITSTGNADILQRSRQYFADPTVRSLIECIPDGLILIDQQGRVVVANGQAEQMFQYARGEMLGIVVEALMPERFRANHAGFRAGFFADLHVRPMGAGLELYGRRKNGEEFLVEISLSHLDLADGPLALAVIRDISARKHGEFLLKKAEVRFRTLVEQIPAICFIAGFQETTGEIYVSPQIEQILGFTQREWLEDPVLWYTRLHPDDKARWHEEFSRTCSEGKDFSADYRFISRSNAVVWIHGEAKIIRDESASPLFLLGIAFDITQVKKAEEILQRSHEQLEQLVRARTEELSSEVAQRKRTQAQPEAILKEREALLKEIHHRVKNNMQITSSLLSLQSRRISDPAALEMIRESQNRVRLMGLLHEKLYRTGDLAHIDFRAYVADLTADLFRTYGVSKARIRLALEIGTFSFDIDTALPCGLVINELVTNCLKYAFPDGRSGALAISMRREEDGFYALEVSDDGVGFPKNFVLAKSDSLGLLLVKTMAEQLGGAAELRAGDRQGTRVTIRFPDTDAGREVGLNGKNVDPGRK